MRRSAVPVVIALVAFAACGDVLHSTDWPSRCEVDPDAEGCEGGSSQGSGGDGGDGSGGEGASTSPSSSSSSSNGSGGKGGESTVGGAGGEGPCQTCLQYFQNNDPSIPPCNGSQREIDAVVACICVVCATECANECSGSMPLGDACMTCANLALQACPDEITACAGDNG